MGVIVIRGQRSGDAEGYGIRGHAGGYGSYLLAGTWLAALLRSFRTTGDAASVDAVRVGSPLSSSAFPPSTVFGALCHREDHRETAGSPAPFRDRYEPGLAADPAAVGLENFPIR
jgi:hypothetical protein